MKLSTTSLVSRAALGVLALCCMTGCGLLQSRRSMMADMCMKEPDLVLSSFEDKRCEWAMSCGKPVPKGCNKGDE